MSGLKHPTSLLIIATAMCAALYAVGSFATASIPSPLLFGQFRPAVIVPAVFGVIFGPIPAAIGAALGTLIADSAKHGTLYMGSVMAAVPGNFIGFYIFGYILKKRFTWTRFIFASVTTLTVGNLITAFLYVFVYKALYAQALAFYVGDLTFLSISLFLYWFVTMLPFILLVVPPLIRAISNAMPNIVPEGIRVHSLEKDLPMRSFSLTMIVPGIVMLSSGLATTFTSLRAVTLSAVKGDTTVLALLEWSYYLSGIVLVVLGILVLIRQKMLKP